MYFYWVPALFIASVLITCGQPETSKIKSQNDQGILHTLLYLGDSRGNLEVYSRILQMTKQLRTPDGIIHLGDFISDPERSEELSLAVSINQTYYPSEHYMPVVGNHDVKSRDSFIRMKAIFPIIGDDGYYTQSIGSMLFIFINSEEVETDKGELSARQLNWLEAQLKSQAAKEASYIFVALHRPLFPQNHHKDEPLANREYIHGLFRENNVTAVMAGHEHSYSHIQLDQIHYFVLGSSGSPLFVAAGPDSAFFHFGHLIEFEDHIKLRVYDMEGVLRDEIRMEPN